MAARELLPAAPKGHKYITAKYRGPEIARANLPLLTKRAKSRPSNQVADKVHFEYAACIKKRTLSGASPKRSPPSKGSVGRHGGDRRTPWLHYCAKGAARQ